MKRIIFFIFLFLSLNTYSQEMDFSKIKPGGVKFYLTEDSSSYFRFFGFNHIWVRYTQMNPGTTDKAGNPMKTDFDVCFRRNRSGFYFHLFERIISFSQFGISTQTYTSPTKPQLFFLDLISEYAFVRDKFHVGYGLHSWNGVARLSNVGAPHFLYIDNPGFAYPLVGTFDQSGRQLGVYTKGLLGDFEYRASISKPFSYDALLHGDTVPDRAFEYHNTNYAYKGYFNWQFFDNEKDVFPWKKMNNLGEKKIFNIGAGFHYHPEAMQSFNKQYDHIKKHDLLLWAVDVFLELPMKNSSSFTGYLVRYDYDFGPDYIKSSGLMNNGFGGEINGQTLLQGQGNAQWSHGTGTIIHIETGYLLPKMLVLGEKQFQVFGGYTYKNLQALDCDLHLFDAGINYFIYGNHIKCGIQYSSRPVYEGTIGDNANGKVSGHKGTVIFNTQIDF